MRVSVDREKCMGHGQCYNTCGEIFVLDERGYCDVAPDTVVPKDLEARARRGAQACPEHAITVVED